MLEKVKMYETNKQCTTIYNTYKRYIVLLMCFSDYTKKHFTKIWNSNPNNLTELRFMTCFIGKCIYKMPVPLLELKSNVT